MGRGLDLPERARPSASDGRDARGRKQHRYHPRFREIRDAGKFDKLIAFARALPKIRAAIARDTRRKGVPRDKILGAVAHLLDTSLIRVGNDDYARQNKSYGLTTLKDRHAEVRGAQMRFEFTGKSGKPWRLTLTDARIAKIVKAARDLPGERLFQYRDDAGNVAQISASDVNAYLREIGGDEISAKDFRTWSGTVLAAAVLKRLGRFDTQTLAKANVKQAISEVADSLGNTPAIARKSYVPPALIDSYLDGDLSLRAAKRPGLSAHEASVLAWLTRMNAKDGRSTRV
jgi:DNA topoisomerase-1